MLVNALCMVLNITMKVVISTVSRPFTLEGGKRNEIQDMSTLMPDTSELTIVAMLIVFTMLKLS